MLSEDAYKSANDNDRQKLKAEVVRAHADKVAAMVRRLVPREHWAEAEQVGALGVLVALEKYTPRGGRFWPFAWGFVRNEIRAWLGQGVFWRKSSNAGKSPERRAAREAAKIHLRPLSLDMNVSGDEYDVCTLHDTLPSAADSVEEIVSKEEITELMREFVTTLSAEEVDAFLTADVRRVRSRQHCSLVERAAAFVKGPENDDDQNEFDRTGVRRSPAAAGAAEPRTSSGFYRRAAR